MSKVCLPPEAEQRISKRTHKYQSASTSHYLRNKSPVEDVQVEWVTDEVLQVVLNLDSRPGRVDRGPWHFVEAILTAASMLDKNSPPEFEAFCQGFTAAWTIVSAQKRKDRQRP